MPDNPISADDYVKSLQAEMSADDYVKSFDQEEAPAPDPVVEDARQLVENQPLRGDQVPQHESPWYQNAFEDIGLPRDFANKVGRFGENVAAGALSNLPDEIGSAAIQGMSTPLERENQGYQGIQPEAAPREYAAGSAFEDSRRTLEDEKIERDKTAPTSAALGNVAGAGLQALALPAGAMSGALRGGATAAAQTAAQTAANYMGQGSGGLGERAEQAVQTAEENPLQTAAGVVLPAVGSGIGGAMSRAAPKLADASAINRTAAIMTPGQRAVYANAKGGKEALIKLGNNMVEKKLHLSSPESWYGGFGPASAENVYDNALALGAKSSKQLADSEAVLKGANPRVKIGGVVNDLRGSADEVSKMADPASTGDASFRQQLASRLEKATEVSSEGPALKPPVPEQVPFEGPWTPEVAPPSLEAPLPPRPTPREGPVTPEIPERQVAPEEWFKYFDDTRQLPPGSPLPPAPVAQEFVPSRGPGQVNPSPAEWREYRKALEQSGQPGQPSQGPGTYIPDNAHWSSYLNAEPKPPAPVATGELPFSDAVKQRRYLDKQTNFTPSGLSESSQNAVRRQAGAKMRESIGEGLDEAAETNPALAEPVSQWRQANKDFSLSKTVEDPALMAMQKEYGGALGLKDMATASAAGALGLPPAAAMIAGKVAKGGRGANALAGSQANLAKSFKAGGDVLPAASLTAGQVALPDAEKNQALVDQIQENDEWDWTRAFAK